MRIVCWNVNSVRTRLEILLNLLHKESYDVVLLQEIKCQEESFPFEVFEALGYTCAVYGQKSYNGVAILSKHSLEDVTKGLGTFTDDPQARYIEAVVAGRFRVASVYIPNGQSKSSEKFIYKMAFLEKFHEHLKGLLAYGEICLIGGDFNIAPTDEDISDLSKWKGEVMCTPQERGWYNSYLNLGYIDCLKETFDSPTPYTWWDYRSGSWPRNQGLRIDHFLASPQAFDKMGQSGILTPIRGLEKTSDHAPIWVELSC